MEGHMLGYAGFFDESPEADIGIVDLVGQFVEDAVFGQAAFPFREPLQSIVALSESGMVMLFPVFCIVVSIWA